METSYNGSGLRLRPRSSLLRCVYCHDTEGEVSKGKFFDPLSETEIDAAYHGECNVSSRESGQFRSRLLGDDARGIYSVGLGSFVGLGIAYLMDRFYMPDRIFAAWAAMGLVAPMTAYIEELANGKFKYRAP